MSFKNDLGTELVRNLVGFFLVGTGIAIICLGAKWHMDSLVTLGTATMIPAALLALQSKRTPEGNTTTTSVTVPPPDVAPLGSINAQPNTPPSNTVPLSVTPKESPK